MPDRSSLDFDVIEKVGAFSRTPLHTPPTPFEPMQQLGRALGRGGLYVKRDDCTELAMGGNKVRQMEFYLGDALARGADTILIAGVVQSNFVRVAAAASCKLGLDCHVQLSRRVDRHDEPYMESGNVLLDRILGATLHLRGSDENDQSASKEEMAELRRKLERQGRRPYWVMAPDQPPLGSLGYILAALEILSQAAACDPHLEEVVVASGSGTTHAGLLFGLRAMGSPIRVTGVCVRRDAAAQFELVRRRCSAIADLLQVDPVVTDNDILLTDTFLEPGYGVLNKPTVKAIETAAQTEGLLLDPVYTGLTMASFLERAEETSGSLLFLHTGGAPALFAYRDDLKRANVWAPSSSSGKSGEIGNWDSLKAPG